MQEALTRALGAQRLRLLNVVDAANGRPTARQLSLFWRGEDTALWGDVQPTVENLALEMAVTASIRSGASTWELVNENMLAWVQDYYTNADAAFVGSVPNLNLTSKTQFADYFTQWQRGTLDTVGSKEGLPQLIQAIEPVFGSARAERIATTEVTRIFSESKIQAARADEFAEYLEYYTSEDELVCPICGPLAGQVIPKGASGFIHPEDGNVGFPPVHVSCRCWIESTTVNVVAATGGTITRE